MGFPHISSMTFCPVDFALSSEVAQCVFYSCDSVQTLLEAESLVYACWLKFLSPSALGAVL